MTERAPWQDDYRNAQADYERLRVEAVYALRKRIDAQRLKLHSLTSRVKDLDSLEEKAKRKGYTAPLDQSPDLVGLRVVVLFRSDMAEVARIVDSEFEVLDIADTVTGSDDPSTFGYLSQHFVARMSPALKGPRYEGLAGISFEVQVRTILMDAWASVSHHLAYKGESSIPLELRRDFDALSGLFYVADTHFGLFFDQTQAIHEQTRRDLEAGSNDVPLNLDTLGAFLERRFPDRERAYRAPLGDLVNELLEFGFHTIGEIDDKLAISTEQLAEVEKQTGAQWPKYIDVGVVRALLIFVDPSYREFHRKKYEAFYKVGPG